MYPGHWAEALSSCLCSFYWQDLDTAAPTVTSPAQCGSAQIFWYFGFIFTQLEEVETCRPFYISSRLTEILHRFHSGKQRNQEIRIPALTCVCWSVNWSCVCVCVCVWCVCVCVCVRQPPLICCWQMDKYVTWQPLMEKSRGVILSAFASSSNNICSSVRLSVSAAPTFKIFTSVHVT